MSIPLYIMAFFYVAAGVNHFVNPRFYMKMMPTYLPYHKPLVNISGVWEIIAGALLFFDATRSLGAWLVIVLLIGVFPGNIQMTVNFWKKKHRLLLMSIVRLPLQFVLIWWAWLYTK